MSLRLRLDGSGDESLVSDTIKIRIKTIIAYTVYSQYFFGNQKVVNRKIYHSRPIVMRHMK
jgi:hypothetical protein